MRGIRVLGLAGMAMVFSVAASPGQAQSQTAARTEALPVALTAQQATALDAYIVDAMRAWRVPGLAVAIVRGDEILYLKGFGYRDGAKKLPVTPDTLFMAASTTKAFAAFDVGLLVDRGKVGWDTPVQTYVPGFAMGDRVAGGLVSLRDMLSHRTGLPRHDFVWYNTEGVTPAELVGKLVHLESSAPLRERFQYNNMMYMATGHVVGRVGGATWEDFTRDNIFGPLGMTRTNFSLASTAKDSNHATGHRENDAHEPQPINLRTRNEAGPSGAINSTARDYAQWLKAHLNKGVVGGKRLITEAQLDAMHSPLIPVGGKPEFAEFTHMFYGMGWFIDSYRGARRVQHGGNLDGFSSLVTLFPDQSIGTIIFSNADINPLPDWLSLDIADRLTGRTPIDWSRKMLARRDLGDTAQGKAKGRQGELKVAGTRPGHPLADYSGTYVHPGYGAFRVELAGDTLRALYNGLPAKLIHWHYEVFNTDTERLEDKPFDNIRVAFQTDLRGRVNGLAVELEPSVASIAFVKRPDARLEDPQYLRRYAGQYKFLDQVFTIDVIGKRLTLSGPGQAPQTFIPEVDGSFAFENARSISVRFVEQAGVLTGFQLLQAEGVYEVTRIASAP